MAKAMLRELFFFSPRPRARPFSYVREIVRYMMKIICLRDTRSILADPPHNDYV